MTDETVRPDISRARRAVGWVGQVLAWAVILTALAALVVAVLVPRLSGATPYAVLTSSMRPSMPEGTLVVVRPTKPAAIGIGSVITYQIRSGEPTVVTHRVVAQSVDGQGVRLFRTRGDANAVPDAQWVKPVQVRGVVWYSVPLLGRVNAALSGSQHRLVVNIVAAGLLGYAAFMFTGTLRDRRTRARAVA